MDMRLAANLILATFIAACAAPATTPGRSVSAQASATVGVSATAPAPTASAAVRPAFLAHVFTDVRDGKQFKLTDFAGKTVLVIGMAVW